MGNELQKLLEEERLKEHRIRLNKFTSEKYKWQKEIIQVDEKNICDNCKFWKNPKTRGTMQFWYGDCLNKKSDRYETKTDEFFSCNYFEARDFSRVRFIRIY